MKRNSHYPLAALMHLAIWGAALPAQAADSSIPEEAKDADRVAVNGEETMVVTAARQTLQAPGVSTLTADEIRKHPPARDISEIFSLDPEARHCPRL
ncbi:TPA: hypothetical protein I8Y12_004207 [Raoultella planticola]|nr:hypothetical protein [Raoultella planticola]